MPEGPEILYTNLYLKKFLKNSKIENIISQYKSVKYKVQDKNEKFTLVSLISHATADGYDVAFSCAKEIITINKEMEEKQRLLQQKINR